MKISAQPIFPRARQGFTLTEMMVTMAIFGMVVAGILSLHIFGMKLNAMVDVKLQATEDSRRALGRLVTDIHSAGIVKVGTGDATSFTEAAFNTAQQGNAIQIYPVKTNSTKFVRYSRHGQQSIDAARQRLGHAQVCLRLGDQHTDFFFGGFLRKRAVE